MRTSNDLQFNHYYQLHCKHLRLKGLQPKTIDTYARAMRRIGDYFNFQVDNLNQNHLLDYFNSLLGSHSWSAVKLDLYGLKFFYTYVLNKPWTNIQLIRPPRTKRIPELSRGIYHLDHLQDLGVISPMSTEVAIFSLK